MTDSEWEFDALVWDDDSTGPVASVTVTAFEPDGQDVVEQVRQTIEAEFEP